jgi:uncharacterized membrane protein HdeD (DUF308 family)
LIALGVIAWLDVIRVAIASTIIIGAILLIAGIFQIVHAFATQQWRSFVLGVLCGVLYFIGGILVMNEPPEGAVVLTLLLAATIVGSGLIRIALAWRHRELKAWGLLLFSGCLSIVLGCLLYVSLPWSALWVLGTLIALELLVQGVGWLQFGLALRAARRARLKPGAASGAMR